MHFAGIQHRYEQQFAWWCDEETLWLDNKKEKKKQNRKTFQPQNYNSFGKFPGMKWKPTLEKHKIIKIIL